MTTYLRIAIRVLDISKTVRVNIAFTREFFKEYSISFLMISRLIDFELLMFKVGGIIGISKIKFFDFFGTERVKDNCAFL